MMGTLFCQYETPCGICTRTGEPCKEHKKPKIQVTVNIPKKVEEGAVKDE